MAEGRTFALYGDSGAGKTTQIGEMAVDRYKRTKQVTRLNTADRGGYETLRPHVKLGIIRINEFPQDGNAFDWVNEVVRPAPDPEVGIEAFDSATSMGEMLLSFCAKSPTKIGQQATQKFKAGESLIGITNEAHFGLVQTFLLDAMFDSSWLIKRGQDVVWTFSTLRGESADQEAISGPMVAGKALTPKVPKWFNYCFRLVHKAGTNGESARRVLYTDAQPGETTQNISLANARYCLNATTPLPAVIDPASVVEALRLIELGQEEALDALRLELAAL